MLAGIEALLKEAIGLDAATIGTSAITRALRMRQAACQMEDVDAYGAHLRQSPAELQELIDTVIVPETWFFRDRGAFDAMLPLARDILSGQPGRKLRLLSLPCSTGEEPYSMSMALLDAGFAPDRFAIDAIDVSSRSITLAQRAIYGRNAFRGEELSFRERHFEPVQGGHRPSELVRRPVRFARGNLFDASLLPGGGYDVVFCRNLLIYFDRPTQDAALQALHRLLAPGGLLFLGPSETGLPSRRDFTWAKLPMAFAFRKVTGAPPPPAPIRPLPRPATAPRPFRPLAPPVLPTRPRRPVRPRPSSPSARRASGRRGALPMRGIWPRRCSTAKGIYGRAAPRPVPSTCSACCGMRRGAGRRPSPTTARPSTSTPTTRRPWPISPCSLTSRVTVPGRGCCVTGCNAPRAGAGADHGA
jgi:chemotaxis protein methyltransferase WspC